ncbi:hypothetical protein DTO164E3_6103 [Paecilomyces variotii]|nr:hypothetical protein DTO164E3_6103 [Paecilomyces variotii]KAJ9247488.1 hypothetical protein DTO207G8_8064 [Paecilomyces variotii]KAJ9296659.1 hypothetical protein DTO217A2_8770 [Paecilomyces variotii]KAJ9363015.1 hypothetical protein DTO280E4_3050 [Paecilomyces variotii]KAJ9374267.1 hypothetical protein DTO282E5_1189 [Paecilomyces variotii]
MDPTGRSAPFLPMITGIVRQQQHRNQLDPTEDDCKRGESKAPGVVDAQTGDGERIISTHPGTFRRFRNSVGRLGL